MDCIPGYETLPGWQGDLREFRHWENFPASPKSMFVLLKRIADFRCQTISVGPERTALIKELIS